jgi:hypothetical protein
MHSSSTNALLITVVALIILLYLSYYSKHAKEVNLIQTFLSNFTPELLYERNPIIIYDALATPKDLLKTIFKYQYLIQQENTTQENSIVAVKSKFSLVFSTNEEIATVKLIHPMFLSSFKWKIVKRQRMTDTDINTTNVSYIDVQLKKHQVMILPPHWIIQSSSILNKIDIDDIISYTYFSIF